MNKAAQAYFQTKVSTTDQGQLLLMLYDGALNFLQQARDKMIAKDYAAKGLLISKAIDIVNELSNTLNMEKGGTLAENLNNLYFLCTARLLQANLKMNLDQLDSVVGILSGLRSAYAQIIETPEAQKAAADIAARMNPAASMLQRAAPLNAPGLGQQGGAMGQMQARAAYGQQARPANAGAGLSPAAGASNASAMPAASFAAVQQPVPSAPQAASAPHSPAPQAAMASNAAANSQAAPQATPQAPANSQGPANSHAAQGPAPHSAAVPMKPALTPPAAPAQPAAEPKPTSGLTKRMAFYGKFAQGA